MSKSLWHWTAWRDRVILERWRKSWSRLGITRRWSSSIRRVVPLACNSSKTWRRWNPIVKKTGPHSLDQFTPHNRDAPHFYVIHSQLNAVLKTIKNKDCMAAPAELRLLNQNQRILWAHLCPYSNRYSCAHRAQNFGAQDGHKHAARNKKFLDRENNFKEISLKWKFKCLLFVKTVV
mgnify:CR=1 FL=1